MDKAIQNLSLNSSYFYHEVEELYNEILEFSTIPEYKVYRICERLLARPLVVSPIEVFREFLGSRKYK